MGDRADADGRRSDTLDSDVTVVPTREGVRDSDRGVEVPVDHEVIGDQPDGIHVVEDLPGGRLRPGPTLRALIAIAGVVLGLAITSLAAVLDAYERARGLDQTAMVNQLFAAAGLSIAVLVPIAARRWQRRWAIPAALAVIGTLIAAVTVR